MRRLVNDGRNREDISNYAISLSPRFKDRSVRLERLAMGDKRDFAESALISFCERFSDNIVRFSRFERGNNNSYCKPSL